MIIAEGQLQNHGEGETKGKEMRLLILRTSQGSWKIMLRVLTDS